MGEQTKSKASERTIFITPDTQRYLLEQRKKHIDNMALLNSAIDINAHVCVFPDGKPLSPDYVSATFKKMLIKHNLPVVRYHDLRHTAASLLLNKGLSAKMIQELLGHEQISTTLDLYGHLSNESKQETARAMGELLVVGK